MVEATRTVGPEHNSRLRLVPPYDQLSTAMQNRHQQWMILARETNQLIHRFH